jgi:hypothetical protein
MTVNIRKKMDVTSNLVGRKVRYTILGYTYTGTILGIISDDLGPYTKGDWFVEIDNHRGFIGVKPDGAKLI